MATWYKQGVYGELTREAHNARRKIERLYASKGEDLFITSICEGTHSAGTLHHQGDAFDSRYPKFAPKHVLKSELKAILGPDYDVYTGHRTHLHVEYDPK